MHYIIGDVHANIRELKKLLQLLKLTSDDSVIFLGDYLDKNPYTRDTLDQLHRLQKQTNCIFIKGNHDFVWERYLIHGEIERKDFLLRYGGVEALRELSDAPEVLLEHNETEIIRGFFTDYIALMSQMRDFHIIDQYIALHAGLLPGQLMQDPLEFSERNFFLREADIDFTKKYLNAYTLVAGHTHFGTEPLIKPAYINLDLGAGYGYYLGALHVEGKQIIRSDAKVFKLSHNRER